MVAMPMARQAPKNAQEMPMILPANRETSNASPIKIPIVTPITVPTAMTSHSRMVSSKWVADCRRLDEYLVG
jgi:hypothetical protein